MIGGQPSTDREVLMRLMDRVETLEGRRNTLPPFATPDQVDALHGRMDRLAAYAGGFDLLARVQCAPQLIPSSVVTSISFTSKDWDTDGVVAALPTVFPITVPTTGWYLCILGAGWDANAAGTRLIQMNQGGLATALLSSVAPAPTGGVGTVQSDTDVLYLTKGLKLDVVVGQWSGASLNVGVNLSISRIAFHPR